MSKKTLIEQVITAITFLLIGALSPANTAASSQSIKIEGDYFPYNQHFEGSVSVTIAAGYSRDLLFFHLPPNRYSTPDKRSSYLLKTRKQGAVSLQRSELGKLKHYRHQNLQVSTSITIQSVRIRNHEMPYQIADNPALIPALSADNGLLIINMDSLDVDRNETVELRITFQTKLARTPESFVDILWDFAPRPVLELNNQPDFADRLTKPVHYHYQLRVVSDNGDTPDRYIERQVTDTVPILITASQHDRLADVDLSLDRYLLDDYDYFARRISNVRSFLQENHWLKRSEFNLYLAVWDGPLLVTGSHILLPQRLFRYHPIYYKTFEVILIRAFLVAALKKRYLLNPSDFPWLIPAFSSEVIRSYFETVYDSDTHYFPWGSWLNPDFYQENSVKKWLSYPRQNYLIAANEIKELEFLTSAFHPWNEKGFHLTRTLFETERSIQDRVFPSIKSALSSDRTEFRYFNDDYFYALLRLTERQIEQSEKWLSTGGFVDYEISNVTIDQEMGKVHVSLSVASLGSLSPTYELRFILQNGLKQTRQITTGGGEYHFTFPSEPVEISIDPEHKLLENNLLNNHWRVPYKVRPIWDFPSSNSWIVRLTPTIAGNTFDRNLFGLSLGITYLKQTEFYLSAWQKDESDRTLWESSIFHHGTPWQGSEISLERSELNASNSKSIGYRHRFFDIHDQLWFSVHFLEETLDTQEADSSSDHNLWQSVESRVSFPVYVGNFSDSFLEMFNGYGRNFHDTAVDFYQQGLSITSIWYSGNWKVHLGLAADYSYGILPKQKKYPMGGPEGLPGFPRETDLLYDQRRTATIGISIPPYLTHTNLNLWRLGWLDRMETTLFLHWGKGHNTDHAQWDIYKDVELRFSGVASWLNMYEGTGVFSIAKPIDHEKYNDYRLILFSSWVF